MKNVIITAALAVAAVCVTEASAKELILVNNEVTTHIVMPENIKMVDLSTTKIIGNQCADNIVRIKPYIESDSIPASYRDGELMGTLTLIGERHLAQYDVVYTSSPSKAASIHRVSYTGLQSYINPEVSMPQSEMARYAWAVYGSGRKYNQVVSKANGMKAIVNNIYSVGDYFFIDYSCLSVIANFRIFGASSCGEDVAKLSDNFQPKKFFNENFQPMCDILQQIRDISEREGITITALERSIGASKGVLSRALTNGTDIQSKWVRKIVENYPQYSAEWLITGRGDALKDSKHPINPHSQAANEPPVAAFASKDLDARPTDRANPGATRPRIPFTAAAGGLSMVAQTATTGECEQVPVIPTFPPYDFTIIIEGDSMAPLYLSGDELACRFVYGADEINWGKPYIVDSDEGAVFKLLYDGGNVVLCRSINPEGPTYEINKRDIHHVAAIVGYLRHTL